MMSLINSNLVLRVYLWTHTFWHYKSWAVFYSYSRSRRLIGGWLFKAPPTLSSGDLRRWRNKEEEEASVCRRRQWGIGSRRHRRRRHGPRRRCRPTRRSQWSNQSRWSCSRRGKWTSRPPAAYRGISVETLTLLSCNVRFLEIYVAPQWNSVTVSSQGRCTVAGYLRMPGCRSAWEVDELEMFVIIYMEMWTSVAL